MMDLGRLETPSADLGRVSVCFLPAMILAAALAGPVAGSPPGPGWRNVFQDNFDGVHLDPRKWSTDYSWGHTLDHQAYMSSDQVKVRFGQLIITGIHQRHRDAPPSVIAGGSTYPLDYTSGAIQSRGKFSIVDQRDAYVEARMKIPATIGAWPAFWMMPAKGGWPPEIDVMEIPVSRTADLRRHRYNYHYGKQPNDLRDIGGTFIGPDFSAGFHTFGVAWSERYMAWYVDNKLVRTIHGDMFAPANDMYLILNLGLGGWPGPPPADAVFPAKFRVDWVRAYQYQPAAAVRLNAAVVPEPAVGVALLLPLGWSVLHRRTPLRSAI